MRENGRGRHHQKICFDLNANMTADRHLAQAAIGCHMKLVRAGDELAEVMAYDSEGGLVGVEELDIHAVVRLHPIHATNDRQPGNLCHEDGAVVAADSSGAQPRAGGERAAGDRLNACGQRWNGCSGHQVGVELLSLGDERRLQCWEGSSWIAGSMVDGSSIIGRLQLGEKKTRTASKKAAVNLGSKAAEAASVIPSKVAQGTSQVAHSWYKDLNHAADTFGGAMKDAGSLLEKGGKAILYRPLSNYTYGNLDTVKDMMCHPHTLIGLGDGGAHVSILSDANAMSYMLTHWTRDRTRGARLPLEWAVRRLTYDNARAVGLNDRGLIRAGAKADINVIDYDRLTLRAPHVVYDLPSGDRKSTRLNSSHRT